VSSFTPRAWKSQPVHEPEHRAEVPVEPLQPREVVKSNNLPIAPTAFIGREGDVAEIKALLEHHRLLTLMGSGGVGKTRLAIHVGA
jgi:flagellar biosynthesis GTPase FlhF